MTETEFTALLPERFTLFLARHATPDRSRLDIPYHIPPGPELTERGRAEAAELGAFLSRMKVFHFLASPLVRAWDTGKIAAKVAGATIELNHDLAEWRPEENQQLVENRMRRAFVHAAYLSQEQLGAVVMVTHGAPVLTTLKMLGLSKEISDRCRIYDSRNPIPMAGAWMIEKKEALDLRLAFVPEGVRWPSGLPSGSLLQN
jgi:2,3-bisphosphoglycerate-dependent phosphoglycerate mutase